ncbi:hypothetical protein [Sneathia sanguinegens]
MYNLFKDYPQNMSKGIYIGENSLDLPSELCIFL